MQLPRDIAGIYKIQSIIKPERIYIGSALNLGGREECHLNKLRYGTHPNPKLLNHYNKYGKNDLVFSVLKACSDEDLTPVNGVIEVEQFFIDKMKPYFNIASKAGSLKGHKMPNRRGYKMSDEAKKHIGEGMRAFWQTEEGKKVLERLSRQRKGRKKPEGFGEKISQIMLTDKHPWRGKKMPKETRDKMSESRMGNKNALGFKHTEETIEKTRHLRKRENLSEETLEKMRTSQLGRKHSEETKRKISISRRLLFQKRREDNAKG